VEITPEDVEEGAQRLQRYLRSVDERLDTLRDDLGDIKERLDDVEAEL